MRKSFADASLDLNSLIKNTSNFVNKHGKMTDFFMFVKLVKTLTESIVFAAKVDMKRILGV